MALVDDIREGAAWVAQQATRVVVERDAIADYAAAFPPRGELPGINAEAHIVDGPAELRAAFFLTLDAINFGSGWFPTIRKRDGRSGYFTVALGLRDRFRAHGAWSARELRALDARTVADVLGQDPQHELMTLFARSLNDLGAHVEDDHGGRFLGPVQASGDSAVALVEELARWDCFRDVSPYRGRTIPLFKRAQVAASDLALAGARDVRRPRAADAVRRQPDPARAATRRDPALRAVAGRADRGRRADRARQSRGGRDARRRDPRRRADRRRARRSDARAGRPDAVDERAAARATRPSRDPRPQHRVLMSGPASEPLQPFDEREIAPLRTARLLLRPWRDDAADLDAYAALCADAEVMCHIGRGHPLTRDESATQLTRFVEHWRRHGFGLRAIVERGGVGGAADDRGVGGDATGGGATGGDATDAAGADGPIVGFVGVMRAGQPGVRPGDVEIGWRLARERWGRGYATEGARAVRDDAFAQLRLQRLVAFVRPGNAASMRVMDKLGMRFEKDGLCTFGTPLRIYSLDNPLAR